MVAIISLMVVGAGGLVLAGFEGLAASSNADTVTAQSKAGKVFDPGVETSGRRENAIAITSAIVGGAALVDQRGPVADRVAGGRTGARHARQLRALDRADGGRAGRRRRLMELLALE